MAGCTDLAFRLMVRQFGPRLCYFEMVDMNCLIHGPLKNLDILKTSAEDTPLAAQLVGSDPEKMLKAARHLLGIVKVSYLEVNSACPVRKIVAKKAGAQLLKDPDRLYRMIETLATNIPLPITVKLRTAKNIVEIARGCEAAGAQALMVHGRTAEKKYSGPVDYAAIRAVKQAVKIPVLGSGNILSRELAEKMFEETGCDGVLAARGALGDPWIFKALTEKDFKPPTVKERIEALKEHISLMEEHKKTRESNRVGFMKKIVIWYAAKFPKAQEFKQQVLAAKSRDKILTLIEDYSYSL